MKKIIIAGLLLFSSCTIQDDPNKLIIPPNFSEMPDASKPEAVSPKEREENIGKLKELLLKSDQ